MKRIVYSCLLLAFFLPVFACEREFTVNVQADPKLFLQCFPGPRDTTIIQLNRTIPTGTDWDGPMFLESAEVVCKVNGLARAVERWDAAPSGSVPEGCWFVTGQLFPGDVISVDARADDLPAIHAETTLPAFPPEFQYLLTAKSVQVSFADNPDSEDWYGLGVLCERTTVQGSVTHIERHLLRPAGPAGSGTPFLQGNNDPGIYLQFNGWTLGSPWWILRVWSDDWAEDGVVNLSMQLTDVFMIWNDAPYTSRYKVCLYRFPRAFYRYAVSVDNVENNVFAQYGLAPAAFSYTNVSGGVGVLAGWTVRETDWIVL